MKKEQGLLLGVIVLILAVIALDIFYVSKFEDKFKEIEKKRLEVSNKLATAKIISEDLNHVRDLVFKNMDVPGHEDTVTHETVFFDFVTECVNDLKMTLISVKPERPITQGKVTIYGYEIKVEGDFFSFGELCSKFENSRRIISLESFEVEQVQSEEELIKTGSTGRTGRREISVIMFVNTYRVKKV
jgi:Tfp pilus assembly protein PilO